MEIYINESSLTGQYFSEAEFSAAVIAFMAIFDKVNEKKLVAYKQRNVLLHKKALLESIFPSSLEQLRNKSLKEAFRRLVFNRSNPKDWTLEQLHLASDVFLCPEIDDTVENTVLAEVAERQLQDENDIPRLLINFKSSPFKNNKIDVFKNDENCENAISLDCTDNHIGFEIWLKQYEDAKKAKDYLVKSAIFTKTDFNVQGAAIYRHKQSKQYWYLDNLHKTHFEVFNAQQEHIGVADLEGNLDRTKKVKGRTINL